MAEGEPKKTKKKTVWKNVYVGRNPDTGKKYFERRKVTIPESGEGPPDELDGLTKEPPELSQRQKPIIGKGYTPSKKTSEEKHIPTFIEKSQPTGDKD
jgi:hypothetical protein